MKAKAKLPPRHLSLNLSSSAEPSLNRSAVSTDAGVSSFRSRSSSVEKTRPKQVPVSNEDGTSARTLTPPQRPTASASTMLNTKDVVARPSKPQTMRAPHPAMEIVDGRAPVAARVDKESEALRKENATLKAEVLKLRKQLEEKEETIDQINKEAVSEPADPRRTFMLKSQIANLEKHASLLSSSLYDRRQVYSQMERMLVEITQTQDEKVDPTKFKQRSHQLLTELRKLSSAEHKSAGKKLASPFASSRHDNNGGDVVYFESEDSDMDWKMSLRHDKVLNLEGQLQHLYTLLADKLRDLQVQQQEQQQQSPLHVQTPTTTCTVAGPNFLSLHDCQLLIESIKQCSQSLLSVGIFGRHVNLAHKTVTTVPSSASASSSSEALTFQRQLQSFFSLISSHSKRSKQTQNLVHRCSTLIRLQMNKFEAQLRLLRTGSALESAKVQLLQNLISKVHKSYRQSFSQLRTRLDSDLVRPISDILRSIVAIKETQDPRVLELITTFKLHLPLLEKVDLEEIWQSLQYLNDQTDLPGLDGGSAEQLERLHQDFESRIDQLKDLESDLAKRFFEQTVENERLIECGSDSLQGASSGVIQASETT